MHGAELTRNHSHRDERGAGVVLNPCMGGHRIVTCNGTAVLTTEGVQDGAAGGIFDDELDQVHEGIGEASGGCPNLVCMYVCMYVCPSRPKNSEAIF